ncbi:MAG: Fe-S cluster assembly protein SufD [Candidatus Competibacteraceae bacterium]|nr:Fe-S cluster assembly protein SufD [Candidatus Competibacteraceae bacterium]
MTAAAPVLSDRYRPAFDAFLANRREPETITRARREAFERFEALGWPSRQQEAWRFTDLSALQTLDLQRPADALVEASILPTLDAAAYRLVFINGRFAPGLSKLTPLPERTVIASLGQVLAADPQAVRNPLDPLPGLAQHPIAALNGAFWEDGAFIYLLPGAVLDHPIHIIFHATGGDTAVYPRLVLTLDDGAQATVVVEYRGQGRYLQAPVVELSIDDGAVLDYHQLQEEAPQAFHLGGIKLRQGRNSQTQLHLLSFGGQLARTDLEALLDDEHASCLLNGLTVGRGNQASNFYVRVDHAHPHGSSQQLFKSVLDGKARSVFDGMIHVRPHAQKTDARQNSRNLLLSKQAVAHSNPRLEILADDVKCGHGSSTGFLDPNAEFYLRARGIPVAQARALLVYAFANDNLNQIRLTPLRERLARLLADRLALDSTEEDPTS